ncbi:DHA2 family multidrug resistance protein-like MFS transporter [Spinactinospora alkalitolerans]|uniref:DHA2 family multidrug resistance protein-like MFS transporter n=1 Tax=Spinactinospora alkalitolerans TaxID=687207 RepID=A0A852U0J0_9ACTN|nr:MFS transporter [Spinactinospora alkalitolerans]NYE47530.1 DHA2 family multidrug resistance protein-like MFS transporter [Spinactinospora alkalitolerans]
MSSDVTAPAPHLRAGPREWTGLAVLTLPLLVLALDVSVLFLAAPHLGADLRPSSTELLWIMDVYGFLIAGFLVTMGTLGDRIGRRRLLMIGAVGFALASLLAAYSTTPAMLIAARAVLGITGATLMPSTLALISNMFKDPRQRGVAIAIWMTTFSAGVAVGPTVGGVLLANFWWGSVFLPAVPVMALLVIAAPVLLPEYRAPGAGRLDLTSAALSLATILPIVYGLKEFAEGGVHWVPSTAVVAGAAVGAVFVRRQRRLADPLIDVRLFGDRTFSTVLVLLLLGIMAVNGVFFLYPQFLQLVHGLSPLQAGLWVIPLALASIIGSVLAPFAARRVRPAHVIAGGAVVSVVGFLLTIQVQSAAGLALLVGACVVAVFGLSPTTVLTTDMVVGSVPPEKAGSAAAMSETSGELGIGLGVAVMGSIAAAVYRAEMAGSVPADVPPEAAEAGRDGINGAVAAAEQLPPRARRRAAGARARGLHQRLQHRRRRRRRPAGRARHRRRTAAAPSPPDRQGRLTAPFATRPTSQAGVHHGPLRFPGGMSGTGRSAGSATAPACP